MFVAEIPDDDDALAYRLPEAVNGALEILCTRIGDAARQRALLDSFSRARDLVGALQAVLLYGGDGEPLRILSSTNVGREELAELQAGDGPIAKVVARVQEQGSAVYLSKTPASSSWGSAWLGTDSHSIVCAPVLDARGDGVVAIVYFRRPGSVRPFRMMHLRVVTFLVATLGHALAMHAASERRIDELEYCKYAYAR